MSRALSLAVAACALALAVAAPASAKTTWLCSPQQTNDPCDYALTSTVVKPDGSRSTQTAKAARNPKVDCFYVYPTVSDQKTPNATLAKDPEIKAIATYQASRFRQDCRVWAPMYKQVTLVGILGGTTDPKAAATAYASAKAAFDDCGKHDSPVRVFAPIGPPRGSLVVEELAVDEIHREPALRE